MGSLLGLAKDYAKYLRYWPHALDVMRRAYANWPWVMISLIIRGTAVGRARDGSSWSGDARQLFEYAKLVAYSNCRVTAVTHSYVELLCNWLGTNVKFTIFNWRGSDLFNMIADYENILGLSVRGKRVLDVGAFVGDSTILFALMGARKVVAVEPSPWAYNVAKKNITINGLSNVVILVNCAVAREDGRTLMLPSSEIAGSFAALSATRGDVPVPTCTLDSLIEKYGPFDVVKMDCEGCEYESIPYSRRVGEVKEILIEYHWGYESLEKKLREEGFEVMFSRGLAGPKLYAKPVSANGGYIYARKKLH